MYKFHNLIFVIFVFVCKFWNLGFLYFYILYIHLLALLSYGSWPYGLAIASTILLMPQVGASHSSPSNSPLKRFFLERPPSQSSSTARLCPITRRLEPRSRVGGLWGIELKCRRRMQIWIYHIYLYTRIVGPPKAGHKHMNIQNIQNIQNI